MTLFSQSLLSVHILAHVAVKLCSLPDSDTYVQHNLYISFCFKKKCTSTRPVFAGFHFTSDKEESNPSDDCYNECFYDKQCIVLLFEVVIAQGWKTWKSIVKVFEVSGKESWKLCLKAVVQRLGPIPNLNSLTLGLFTTFHPRKILESWQQKQLLKISPRTCIIPHLSEYTSFQLFGNLSPAISC